MHLSAQTCTPWKSISGKYFVFFSAFESDIIVFILHDMMRAPFELALFVEKNVICEQCGAAALEVVSLW